MAMLAVSAFGSPFTFKPYVLYISALQCLRAASHSTNIARAEDALITLSVTSMAYSTATIALGFSKNPSLNLYELMASSAVAVVYLNLLACPVVVFLQYKNSRNLQEKQSTRRTRSARSKNIHAQLPPILAKNGLTLAVILQTWLFLACAMLVFGKAYTFGDAPECNRIFVVSLFHPFPILPTSRRVILGFFGAATILYVGYYAFLIGKAALPYFRRRLAAFHGIAPPHSPPIVPPDGSKVFDRKFFATTAALLILSTIHIANTELLKIYNEKRTNKVDNSWSFGQVSGDVEFWPLIRYWTFFAHLAIGQILPLFLAAYSVWSAFKTFQESGFFKNPRPHRSSIENAEWPSEGPYSENGMEEMFDRPTTGSIRQNTVPEASYSEYVTEEYR